MAFSWTIPGRRAVDELVEHAQTAIPGYYGRADREREDLEAFAEMVRFAGAVVDDWTRQTYLTLAEGTWLDAHARDRGTRRQADEADAELVERLQVPGDVVTRPVLLARADALLALAGVVGSATMLEGPDLGFFLLDTPGTPADADGFGFLADPDGSAFGWRWMTRLTLFVLVLPDGTPGGTAAAISEDARQHKAGGVTHSVEIEEP
jgi:hypothetical protein